MEDTSEPLSLYQSSVSDVLDEKLTEYAKDIIFTTFPRVYDGLKRIEARYVYIASQIRDEGFISSGAMAAKVKEYHPLGDSSIEDCLVRLAQSWNTRPPLVYLSGKSGTYSGQTAAEKRYTKMQVTPFCKALFFKGIDLNSLPVVRGPSDKFEPKYFIPTIPSALLYDNLSIGFAYQSKTASLDMGNICDLVVAYAEHKKTSLRTFPIHQHIEKLLPDFPTPCMLTNAAELRKEYARGNFNARIEMEGRVILSDKDIVIESLPHGDKFEQVKIKLQKAVRDRLQPFDRLIDNVLQLNTSAEIGNVLIPLKRGANPFETLEHINTLVKTSGGFVPNPNYTTPEGVLIAYNYLSILELWYDARYRAILATKRKTLSDLSKRRWTIDAQMVIADHTDEAIQIIRTNTPEQAINALCHRFKLTRFQSQSLLDLNLSYLANTSKDRLMQRKTAVLADLDKLQQSFEQVHDEIAQAALSLKKEFYTKRTMKIPDYIGYVEVDHQHWIQYESCDDIISIAENFGSAHLVVKPYTGPHRIALDARNKPIDGANQKYGTGSILSFEHDPLTHPYVTTVLNNGTARYVNRVAYGKPGQYFYTETHATSVNRAGILRSVEVARDISQRKQVDSRGASSDWIALLPPLDKPIYTAVLGTHDKNILIIQKLFPHDQRLILPPLGTIELQWTQNPLEWCVNIPKEYLNRMALRVVYIPDVDQLLGDQRYVKFDLNNTKTKRNIQLELIA